MGKDFLHSLKWKCRYLDNIFTSQLDVLEPQMRVKGSASLNILRAPTIRMTCIICEMHLADVVTSLHFMECIVMNM